MTRNVLTGALGVGWLLWLYNLVRYRGLARTTRRLIEQNTRLIDANESLRWQNSSLLAERTRRPRPPTATAREPDAVIDLTGTDARSGTDAGDARPHDESRDAGS
jgi:hypothetical protein